MVENRGISRPRASAIAGLVAWFLGIGSVLSFNKWQDLKLWGMTYFELMDYMTSNVMLPLGGLLIAIFSVWLMSKNASIEELAMGEKLAYKSWRITVRYIAPIGVIVIFLHKVGVL
ncbi:MAG: sodium-dependent transporter, partial [Gammaproteobacteria bacterium]